MGEVQCIECANWRPKETDKAMVLLGFAICRIRSINAGNNFSGIYRRECDKFSKAQDDVIAARKSFDERKAKK